MSDSQEAIDALDRVISDYNYGICGNRTVDDNATDIEAVRAALQSKPDDVYSPCVSCGKQSDTSTPDDAPMCWQCFGEFNANCYDELKAEREWQPIETAPKDGTKILLAAYKPHFDIVDTDTGQDSIRNGWSFWWSVSGYWSDKLDRWTDGCDTLASPNFWMTLPQPPEEKAGD